MDNSSQFPAIQHETTTTGLEHLLSLPDAKFIETKGLQGITQLQAVKLQPRTELVNGVQHFIEWQEIGNFQFKIMLSPNKTIIRLELYDPNMFAILLEQLIDAGYKVISSGEDVEFTLANSTSGGWLGWAHLIKRDPLLT